MSIWMLILMQVIFANLYGLLLSMVYTFYNLHFKCQKNKSNLLLKIWYQFITHFMGTSTGIMIHDFYNSWLWLYFFAFGSILTVLNDNFKKETYFN